jgi:hypothetical protein
VIVKLQGHADDVIAFGLEQGSRHRGIDAARHGDDDPGIFRPAFKIETVPHSRRGSTALHANCSGYIFIDADPASL